MQVVPPPPSKKKFNGKYLNLLLLCNLKKKSNKGIHHLTPKITTMVKKIL